MSYAARIRYTTPGAQVILEVPEGKDPFAVCNLARQHLFPSVTRAQISAFSARLDAITKDAKPKGRK